MYHGDTPCSRYVRLVSASHKCLRCKTSFRLCFLPTGILKARGLKLARVLAEATEHDDTVKAAQLAVRRAFQKKTDAAYLSTKKIAAANKRQERKLIALERTADAAEATAVAMNKMVRSLRSIDDSLFELSQSYNRIHQDALQAYYNSDFEEE
ncbi:hypothetical protein F5B21DRAFT_224872 [Xylaria acuta]|nr:hypothetical protein F5B21DRAFT_224872 [Xylaria acuta]